MTMWVYKAHSSGARPAAAQFHPSVLQRVSFTIKWRQEGKQENKHYMYYVLCMFRVEKRAHHLSCLTIKIQKCIQVFCFEPSVSKNETHVLQLIPYLQEPSWEVFATVHSLEVSNKLLAGHLFPNVLKGVSEKHNIIFLLLSKTTGMSNIILNASFCSLLSPRQAALKKHSRDYS